MLYECINECIISCIIASFICFVNMFLQIIDVKRTTYEINKIEKKLDDLEKELENN